MNFSNSDTFQAQLGQMSERKGVHFVLALARVIARSIDRASLKDNKTISRGRSLLERSTAQDGEILDDPVVTAFLRQVLCPVIGVDELVKSCQVAGGKTLGWAWENLPYSGSGGSNLYPAMLNNSLTNFSNFVSSICRINLERSIASTFKTFNFLDGGNEDDLYGIDLGVNFITTYEAQYSCYFTGDDVCRDLLLTHDLESLVSRVHDALTFELERLSTIKHDESNSMRDTHLFNSAVITRNGVEIFKIPLRIEGCDQSVNPNLYGLKFRSEINSDPERNYQINLNGVEALEASPKELRVFSKDLPRQAALKLRGMSIEQDLGM